MNNRALLQNNSSQMIMFTHHIKGEQKLYNAGNNYHSMSQPLLMGQAVSQTTKIVENPQKIFEHRQQKSMLITQILPSSQKSAIKINPSQQIIARYSNAQPLTPQHVSNNFRFVSPGKIT